MYKYPQKQTIVPLLFLILLLLGGCTSAPAAMPETNLLIEEAGEAPSTEVQTIEVEAPAPDADAQANAGEAPTMTVYKSPTCGCCQKWVEIMEAEGFTVVTEDVADMSVVKAEHGVLSNLQSCHTAIVDGYVIEGHVPADAIEQLLAERPDVTGLAVPGMPVGSPGMEVDGYGVEPFTVIAFDVAGNTEPFASYPK